MAASQPMLLKVIILGDSGVGKSSLVSRFVSHKFEQEACHTIGLDFLNKSIVVEGETFTVEIWESAGQERFKSLGMPFYRGSDCCMLTYGVDDRQSFHNLTMWKKEFLNYADIDDGENFPFVLLGNKVDLEAEERHVMAGEAKQWCADNGSVPYYETSAKTAVNVEEAFITAVRRVVELDRKNDVRGDVGQINLNQKPSNVQKKGDCC